jgi:hypothetical protein
MTALFVISLILLALSWVMNLSQAEDAFVSVFLVATLLYGFPFMTLWIMYSRLN